MPTEVVKPTENTIEAQIESLRENAPKSRPAGEKNESTSSMPRASSQLGNESTSLVDQESFQEVGLFARHRSTYFGMADKEVPGGWSGHRLRQDRSPDRTSGQPRLHGLGGAAGEVHCAKIADTMRLSLKTGSPFIFINDSGGASVQEGIDSLAGYAQGVLPQRDALGHGAADFDHLRSMRRWRCLQPGPHRFHYSDRGAQMFITGPQVIKQVTGEVVTADQLGGPAAQMNTSGVIHLIAEDDEGAMLLCRRLLSFLPSNNLEDPPRLPHESAIEDDPELNQIGASRSQDQLRRAQSDPAHRDRPGFL